MIIDTHVGAPSKEHLKSKSLSGSKEWKERASRYKKRGASRRSIWLEDYIKNMSVLGLDKLVIHAIAPSLAGCKAYNDVTALLCEKYPESLIGFACVPLAYPDDAVDELQRAIKDLGLSGLKIYPKWQGVKLDSNELKPIFGKAAQLGIPILTHCDSYPYSYTGSAWSSKYTDRETDDTACNAARLFRSEVLDNVPSLKIICAHLGGGIVFYKEITFWAEESRIRRIFNQLYFDLAPAEFYSEKIVRAAIDVVGEDRILFGTDFSLYGLEGAKTCIEKAKAYNLPEDIKEKILSINAMKLLGI